MNFTSTHNTIRRPSHAEIAVHAYGIFQQRGGAHGFDVDDWLLAESELLHRATVRIAPPAAEIAQSSPVRIAAPVAKASKPAVKVSGKATGRVTASSRW